MKELLEYIGKHAPFLDHNKVIFNILEGDLMTYLQRSLQEQFTGNSCQIAIQRAAPINILKKIIDKLSQIYSNPPMRVAKNVSDQELVYYYSKELDINCVMSDANENFNAYKNTAVEIYHDELEQEIYTRAMPSFSFLPKSSDTVNPMRMTEFIKFMEKKFWIYTNDSFVSIDTEGNTISTDMAENQGINPYGVIPFAYVSRSKYLIIPDKDTDILKMILLIPVLLTDMNFASMFLSNPILYGVDVNFSNAKLAPNVFWDLKSTEEGKAPQIGVLKPEPDLEAQINLIKEELMMWLDSKNIKTTSSGRITAEGAVSGISLIIQEMDTTKDKEKQITFFKKFERDFWKKLAVIHNFHAMNGSVENRKLFSPDFDIEVIYPEQRPVEDRESKVRRLKAEVDAGFKARRSAIKELNPNMSDEQVEEEIEEMDEKNIVEVVNVNETSKADDSDTESIFKE
jgi:hypothetical protein